MKTYLYYYRELDFLIEVTFTKLGVVCHAGSEFPAFFPTLTKRKIEQLMVRIGEV